MQRWARNHAFVIVALAIIAVQVGLVSKLQARPAMPLQFERSVDFTGFAFHNGAEFPGASGGFGPGAGVEGKGAELRFAFECSGAECGRYVAGIWTPPEPIAVAPSTHLAFDFRPSPGAQLALRIEDETRQIFQVVLPVQTLAHPTQEGWRRLIFPLSMRGGEYWGGANTGKLEGRVRSIAFLARRTGEQDKGSFGFDRITVEDLSAPPEVRLRRDHPLVRPLDYATPAMGVGTQRIADLSALSRAGNAGARVVRVDFPWWDIDQGGRFDFSRHDRLLEALKANGQSAIFLTSFRHSGYGTDPFRDPRHRAAYLRYLRAAAAHFKGRDVVWEIINEPDAPGDNHAPPELFAELLVQSADAVRSADPNARLITGGLSWANPDYLARMLPALGRHRAAVDRYEGFGLHLYRHGGPESAASSVDFTRRMLRRHLGRELPIWVTEWGYSSFDLDAAGNGHTVEARAAQAAHLQRILLALSAIGAPVYTHYVLHDNGPDPRNNEHNHGLITHDMQPKPVLWAFATFANLAHGRQVAGVLDDLPDGVLGLRLAAKGGQDVIAIWTMARNGRADIVATGADFSEMRTAVGAATRIAPEETRRVAITEAGGPLFFIVRP
jgi:GH35 family endo-1,4-beta-xylanase